MQFLFFKKICGVNGILMVRQGQGVNFVRFLNTIKRLEPYMTIAFFLVRAGKTTHTVLSFSQIPLATHCAVLFQPAKMPHFQLDV